MEISLGFKWLPFWVIHVHCFFLLFLFLLTFFRFWFYFMFFVSIIFFWCCMHCVMRLTSREKKWTVANLKKIPPFWSTHFGCIQAKPFCSTDFFLLLFVLSVSSDWLILSHRIPIFFLTLPFFCHVVIQTLTWRRGMRARVMRSLSRCENNYMVFRSCT